MLLRLNTRLDLMSIILDRSRLWTRNRNECKSFPKNLPFL
ncbi:hypothetical protein CKA32_004842 [Geitlerinema sp. FC II]|nr:hypothetical protein CKA32_004842 [Geitlerinema sp. FC II]